MPCKDLLTAIGTARVLVNDTLGPEWAIVCGNGKGDPPSASTFNIGSDPVFRAAVLMPSRILTGTLSLMEIRYPPLDLLMTTFMH
jgi:hypothetical protein